MSYSDSFRSSEKSSPVSDRFINLLTLVVRNCIQVPPAIPYSQMRGKNDLHPSYYGLCQLILFFALVHGGRPDARYNWIFAIPIFILYIYSVLFCASDSPTSDYAFASTFFFLIPTTSDYILLRHRQSELRKIGQKKATSEMTFTERLMWAISLLATPRGIGWVHEPTAHLPPRPMASRKKFIASQFFWILFYSILWNITIIHTQENPCFRTGGPSFAAFGWWWRTTGWVYVVSLYCTMSGVYVIGSILSVATGLYEPRDWPHLFGSPFDAYTVRKCWGYVLTIISFGHPPHKVGQSRLASAASQDPHKQLKFSCKCFTSPKRQIYNLLQTFHVVFHLWTHPRNCSVHTPPEFLPRQIRSIFHPPSGLHHIRRRGYRYRLTPGIQGMQSIQANWFCLGVRVVHLLPPIVCGPHPNITLWSANTGLFSYLGAGGIKTYQGVARAIPISSLMSISVGGLMTLPSP